MTALCQAGVPAAFLNSSLTPSQYRKAMQNLLAGQYKIIYIAPERLLSAAFIEAIAPLTISLVAVDEAHCISQWGKDFRPDYAEIPRFVAQLPCRPVVAAFTATATDKVRRDIIEQLQLQNYAEFTTSFDRPNLYFEVQQPRNKDAALLRIVKKHAGESGIVYCATRKAVESVCSTLLQNDVSAARYHAGLSAAERSQSQEAFLFDTCDVIVATNAFGMGIDKSNVRFVVHYNLPLDLESYYQEAGRGGRDGLPADCILLYAKSDVMTGRFLIEKGNEVAEVESEEERSRLLERGYERLKSMTFYATTSHCLRHDLLQYFGEDAPQNCGNCGSCLGVERASAADGPAHTAAPRGKEKLALAPQDVPLFNSLRELRLALAKRRGVPAFAVFTDATLLEIACKKPATSADFLRISGVGTKKLEDYGTLFLQAIAQNK